MKIVGFDNVSVHDIVVLMNQTEPILVKLMNTIFQNGIFSNILKVNKVTPMFFFHRGDPIFCIRKTHSVGLDADGFA